MYGTRRASLVLALMALAVPGAVMAGSGSGGTTPTVKCDNQNGGQKPAGDKDCKQNQDNGKLCDQDKDHKKVCDQDKDHKECDKDKDHKKVCDQDKDHKDCDKDKDHKDCDKDKDHKDCDKDKDHKKECTATLSGCVRCAAGAMPVIAGAAVQLLQGSVVVDTTKTGPNGCFQFLKVQPGTYTLQVSATDYSASTIGPITVTGCCPVKKECDLDKDHKSGCDQDKDKKSCDQNKGQKSDCGKDKDQNKSCDSDKDKKSCDSDKDKKSCDKDKDKKSCDKDKDKKSCDSEKDKKSCDKDKDHSKDCDQSKDCDKDCCHQEITLPVIKLAPLPVNFLSNQVLCGKVFFGDASRQIFVTQATTGITLTDANHFADLMNPAYVSPNFAISYNYVGFIPEFPELGHFGGPGEPKIYVFITQALLPDTSFTCSFENQVGVSGTPVGTNGHSVGTPGNYTFRFEFLMPISGPGAAHNYMLSNVYLVLGTTPPTTVTGSIIIPAATDIAPGSIAFGVGQFVLPPSITGDLFVTGSYTDVCGQVFPFTLTPPAGSGPGK